MVLLSGTEPNAFISDQKCPFQASEITPNLSLLSDVLYESEFESQLWMLYNSNKQFVACGDAYPSRWSIKVRFILD